MIYFRQLIRFIIFEREDLKQLLTFAACESFFIFDGEYYTQTDGAAVGSSWGQRFVNAFLCYFEKKVLLRMLCRVFTKCLQIICWRHFFNFWCIHAIMNNCWSYESSRLLHLTYFWSWWKQPFLVYIKICKENNTFTTILIVLWLYYTKMV